ncbi:hypothetical protein ZIOFF_047571 [Zingiber officinale]|uniref:non-specific serine/threonine protein kinase n=1 Tax=Zingiber officinale TaxID=94328 RepID=A0A8J5FXJ6_ZINOF|nr:hypothetical protein ZIOFF_047571 [Zingiber officinale]
MLVGAYSFEDQNDPKNIKKIIKKIMSVQYKIPDYVHISQECRQFISRIFVANPTKRITIREIKSEPWFLRNLPKAYRNITSLCYQVRSNLELDTKHVYIKLCIDLISFYIKNVQQANVWFYGVTLYVCLWALTHLRTKMTPRTSRRP